MGARKYLRLTRAHTAPLETIPAVIGATLALGTILSIEVLLWGLFGVLYHLSGYGMNSLFDYINGHDEGDPNKQHHPLVRGSMTTNKAWLTVSVLMVSTVTLGFYLAFPSIRALSALIISIGAGVSYNLFSKRTVLKPLPIAVAHMMVFYAPYVALGGDRHNIAAGLSIAYIFLWVAYQIGISGEVKDIETDDTNLLVDMGCHVESGHLHVVPSVKTFGYIMRMAMTGTVMYIAAYLGGDILVVITTGIISFSTMLDNGILLSSGTYDRDDRIGQMSAIEMRTLIAFTFAFSPLIGIVPALALITAAAVWVLSMNRIEWGTWLAPRV